jgi:hypothetical protein
MVTNLKLWTRSPPRGRHCGSARRLRSCHHCARTASYAGGVGFENAVGFGKRLLEEVGCGLLKSERLLSGIRSRSCMIARAVAKKAWTRPGVSTRAISRRGRFESYCPPLWEIATETSDHSLLEIAWGFLGYRFRGEGPAHSLYDSPLALTASILQHPRRWRRHSGAT